MTTGAHAQAAKDAVGHLDAAMAALLGAYDHPHHAGRLDNIDSQLRNVASIIERMPDTEASRAEYAGRLLAMHKAMDMSQIAALPDHGKLLLQQELERTA